MLKNATEFSSTVMNAPSIVDPLVKETQTVFKKMDSTTDVIEPLAFWERLKQRKPEFGQMAQGGGFMQQDAEECLTEILNCVNGVIRTPEGKGTADDNFGIETQTETRLAEEEGGSEEPTTRTEKTFTLQCHIHGNKQQEDGSMKGATDMLPQGISYGLEGSLEKQSPSLGRSGSRAA